MTINVYEFTSTDLTHPPQRVTRGVSLDTAHTCALSTIMAQVVPAVDVRIATDGDPTSTDYFVTANAVATIRVGPKSVVTTIKATAA